MITMLVGEARGNAAPVRALYVDGVLVATYCALTTARDLAAQIKLICGDKVPNEMRCNVASVTAFPESLPAGVEPEEVVVEAPKILDLREPVLVIESAYSTAAPAASAPAFAVEGAPCPPELGDVPLSQKDKAALTRLQNKAKKDAAQA